MTSAADDADQRVDPNPLRGHGDEKGQDRQHRRRRVGKYMNVGGAQVVIAMVMMSVGMAVTVMVSGRV